MQPHIKFRVSLAKLGLFILCFSFDNSAPERNNNNHTIYFIYIHIYNLCYKVLKYTVGNFGYTTSGHDWIINNLLLKSWVPIYCMIMNTVAELLQPGSGCASCGQHWSVAIALLYQYHCDNAMLIIFYLEWLNEGVKRRWYLFLLSRCVEKAGERCLKWLNTCSKQHCSGFDTRRLETEGNCCKCDRCWWTLKLP